jgi:transposase InsO family protein
VTASAAGLPGPPVAVLPSQLLPVEVLRRPVESAQYTSGEFARFCQANSVRTSVGRTGVCWDNAAAESFFAALKNEMYHRQVFPTRAKARFAVADYIEVFYNRQRLHSTLGYRTPAEVLTEFQNAATAA